MGLIGRHPVLVCIILFFFAIQLFSPGPEKSDKGDNLSRFILTLAYYPQKLVSVTTEGLTGVWQNYIYLVNTEKENEELKEKLRKLRHEKIDYWETKLQNQRLRNLLKFKKNSPYKVITANVIAGSPSALRSQVVIIDRGIEDGVSKGMPVANYEGIVGRVLLAGKTSSEVILITDPVSAVDAYIHRTRARGIVKGTGNGCVMQYIEKISLVNFGDKVISSGKDGFFPKGVIIGTVKEIETQGGFVNATVSPEVDIESLEEVLVIFKSPENVVLNE